MEIRRKIFYPQPPNISSWLITANRLQFNFINMTISCKIINRLSCKTLYNLIQICSWITQIIMRRKRWIKSRWILKIWAMNSSTRKISTKHLLSLAKKIERHFEIWYQNIAFTSLSNNRASKAPIFFKFQRTSRIYLRGGSRK